MGIGFFAWHHGFSQNRARASICSFNNFRARADRAFVGIINIRNVDVFSTKILCPPFLKHNVCRSISRFLLLENYCLTTFSSNFSDFSSLRHKDLFDLSHNLSHLTLYPAVLKIKTIIVVKQNFKKMPFVYYL